jgi:hypothetical protein
VSGGIVDGVSTARRVAEDGPSSDAELGPKLLEVVDEDVGAEWRRGRQTLGSQCAALVDPDDAQAPRQGVALTVHEVVAAQPRPTVDVEHRRSGRFATVIHEEPGAVHLEERGRHLGSFRLSDGIPGRPELGEPAGTAVSGDSRGAS